ncbi:MAG: hypothetical protein ABSG84_14290 [Acidobacteriaceae bacterium]|jgi:hypothetical protein
MKVWSAVAIAVVIVGLGATPAVSAISSNVPSPGHTMFAKSKVKIALRNDSGAPLQLKVGDEIVSLDAGKSIALKLVVGTRIVVNTATDKHPAGELIAEASTTLDNTILAIQ